VSDEPPRGWPLPLGGLPRLLMVVQVRNDREDRGTILLPLYGS